MTANEMFASLSYYKAEPTEPGETRYIKKFDGNITEIRISKEGYCNIRFNKKPCGADKDEIIAMAKFLQERDEENERV